ncbi:MAG: 6,7-dimethyl-8-ribityllumazine synthase [Desulfurellaceae bacterium]|jgi:6,7-dimethyl-8-ribityllumazine synthase|nr:6,7-dimethyl-8-ribityllumazine synthase [Desulfurellaceae bacterium]
MNIEGNLDAAGLKIGIVVSRFNSFITERLVEGAIDAVVRHNGKEENVAVVKVPGAFEIPYILNRMANSKKYDGIICLGAVIRGATPHFDFIANETIKGISSVALKVDIPVAMGILTTDTIEQAIERAGTKMGNKGFDAAVSLVEMVNLYKKI